MIITLEQLEAALATLAKDHRFQGSEVRLHNTRLLRILGKPLTAAEELAIAESRRRAVNAMVSPSFVVGSDSEALLGDRP